MLENDIIEHGDSEWSSPFLHPGTCGGKELDFHMMDQHSKENL